MVSIKQASVTGALAVAILGTIGGAALAAGPSQAPAAPVSPASVTLAGSTWAGAHGVQAQQVGSTWAGTQRKFIVSPASVTLRGTRDVTPARRFLAV